MERLQTSAAKSIEQQLAGLETSELWTLLEELNLELAKFGIKTPISVLIYGASSHGSLYEDRRYSSGRTKPSPLNCLMTLLHSQPNLKQLPTTQFEDLAGIIARISMVSEMIIDRTNGFTWPDQFCKTPQTKAQG